MYTPQVSSPFSSSPEEPVIGSKETLIWLAVIVPCEKRLSVTVGISELVSGDNVPTENVSDNHQSGN